jgi:hypothetical protein
MVSIKFYPIVFRFTLTPFQDAAFQKYLLLSGQQDTLRRQLSSISGSPPARLSNQSSFFSASPSYDSHSGSSSPSESVYPLPPVTFGHCQYAPAHTAAVTGFDPADASSDNVLYDVNQAIKATLTELLNRDEVKHDERLRAWVQERLMDTQLELRRQRRRRSSTSDSSRSGSLE